MATAGRLGRKHLLGLLRPGVLSCRWDGTIGRNWLAIRAMCIPDVVVCVCGHVGPPDDSS
jgi:hypothetical protein